MTKIKNIQHSNAVNALNIHKVAYNYYFSKRKNLSNLINTICVFLLYGYSKEKYRKLRHELYNLELQNTIDRLNYHATRIYKYKHIIKYHNREYAKQQAAK